MSTSSIPTSGPPPRCLPWRAAFGVLVTILTLVAVVAFAPGCTIEETLDPLSTDPRQVYIQRSEAAFSQLQNSQPNTSAEFVVYLDHYLTAHEVAAAVPSDVPITRILFGEKDYTGQFLANAADSRPALSQFSERLGDALSNISQSLSSAGSEEEAGRHALVDNLRPDGAIIFAIGVRASARQVQQLPLDRWFVIPVSRMPRVVIFPGPKLVVEERESTGAKP